MQRTIFVSCKIELLIFGVITIEIAHFIVTFGDLSHQFSPKCVPIKVLITTLFGEHREMPRIEFQLSIGGFSEITLIGFTQCKFCYPTARIHHIKIHLRLMTIEGHHRKFIRIARSHNARDVSFFREWHSKLSRCTTFEVVAMDRHGGVLRSSDGIFIVVGARIFGIFGMTWRLSFKHLHTIHWHFRFIVAYPAQHLTIGCEIERSIGGKFFFIHPVGDTIDDFIALTIFGYLRFSITIKEFHHKEIVIAHKCYNISIGRKTRGHLRSTIRKGNKLAVCYVIDVINSR